MDDRNPTQQPQADIFVDVAGMQTKYNELLAALTATIDPPGASKEGPTEGARRLAVAYEQLMASCNGVLDDLVALRQQVALQPKMKHEQQQQQQQQAATADATKQTGIADAGNGQPESMDVDGQQGGEVQQQQMQDAEQQQQVAAALAQQHRSFLQQLQQWNTDGLPVGE